MKHKSFWTTRVAMVMVVAQEADDDGAAMVTAMEGLVEEIQADTRESAALECDRLGREHPGRDDYATPSMCAEAIRALKP